LDLGIFGRDQQIKRALNVGSMTCDRIGDGFGHGRQRRLVQHDADAGTGSLADRRVGHVPFDKIDLSSVRREVLALPGNVIVQNADAAAVLDQSFHQMRADETGPARDQVFHGK
jgi:hypothetical protein